ncbi:hypothetical protein BSLA_01r0188 [Burkholderia stabilis]|nr:hypothetical protein BSLA_01r0188 [Burkholderia stabilis]
MNGLDLSECTDVSETLDESAVDFSLNQACRLHPYHHRIRIQ